MHLTIGCGSSIARAIISGDPEKVYHAFYMVHTVVEVGTVVFPLFRLGFIHHPWWCSGVCPSSWIWIGQSMTNSRKKLPCKVLPVEALVEESDAAQPTNRSQLWPSSAVKLLAVAESLCDG